MTSCVKCYLPGNLIRDPGPGVFIGRWSHRHPLPTIPPNSRHPEGKHVLNINPIFCINHLNTVNHAYQGITVSKSMFPDAGQGPSLQTDLQAADTGLLC